MSDVQPTVLYVSPEVMVVTVSRVIDELRAENERLRALVGPDHESEPVQNMNDEIERLRADARQKGLDHITTIGELMDAQVEIGRLRALITEWADASDTDNNAWQRSVEIAERAETFAAKRNAELELRRAVGR